MIAVGQFCSIVNTRIHLNALDPFQQRLRHEADLRGVRFDRGPQRGVLPAVLLTQAHRTLTDLG